VSAEKDAGLKVEGERSGGRRIGRGYLWREMELRGQTELII